MAAPAQKVSYRDAISVNADTRAQARYDQRHLQRCGYQASQHIDTARILGDRSAPDKGNYHVKDENGCHEVAIPVPCAPVP